MTFVRRRKDLLEERYTVEMKGKTVQNAVRNGPTTLTSSRSFFLHIS